MKTLVTIANYGTGNDKYLARVLDELRRMGRQVHIVVTSNIAKDLGDDVEVIVGMPTRNPRSLPFAHKQIFADRKQNYDTFIYLEDDILISKHNIDAFLEMTDILPPNEYAGFLRTETDSTGKIYFPDVHQHFHWDAGSVLTLGDRTFAFFTNEHSGCYVLTRDQLDRAIASGGFLTPFHEGDYGPLESAATDPFTQCGFRKLICISHLSDFIVPHLSNKYAGKECLSRDEFYLQIRALPGIGNNCKPKATLFPVQTKLYHMHWSKNYYEPCQNELLRLVPEGSRTILSVGCGWGATERALIEKGMRVKGLPIDSVVAVNAEARGVEVVYGDMATARQKLRGEHFDCVLFSNVLHLVRDPVTLLSSFAEFLAPGGCIVASVPNLSWFRRASRSIRLRGLKANPISYEVSGMHVTNGRLLKHWFRDAGLNPLQVIYEVLEEKKRADAQTLGLAKPLLASNVYLSGTPVPMGPK